MKTVQKIFVIIIFIITLAVLTKVYLIPIFQKNLLSQVFLKSFIQPIKSTPTLIPTNTEPIISPQPQIQPTIIIKKTLVTPISTKNIISDTSPWGVAQQIDEHTWQIRVGEDPTMATPSEILEALNNYRVNHGSQRLTMDSKLNEYAQSRADFIYQRKALDGHQGFIDFLNNEDGFNKLGFTWIGENASFGYRQNGVHLIEWIYAGDEPHDKNQLNNAWNYVGIGVKSTATCLIFATGKM